jgi:HEAT repeat protein
MGTETHPVLLLIAWALLVVFTVSALVIVIALLGIRAARRATADWRQRNSAAIRARLVAAMVEEGPDAVEADRELLAFRGLAWDRAETAMLAMLPKVRGDARQRLLDVLRTRGTERRALAQVFSRRAFARCEGAFALGVLRSVDGIDHLIALLDDRSALVQRVAVRSLGQVGDARAVEPLVRMANRDLGLMRDLAFALSEIGSDGAPFLRAVVEHALSAPDDDDRAGPLAASVLGIVRDVGAPAVLADAVARGPAPLKLAAAQALGHLDSPLGVAPLQAALSAPSEQVRVAAATSLGQLGANVAIPALLEAVGHRDPATARAAAGALLDLGPAGQAALDDSASPYAVEALALAELRSPR